MRIAVFFLCCFFCCFANEQRVYAHLELDDIAAAVIEAEEGFAKAPESKEAHLALIHALSAEGNEIAALSRWKELVGKFPEEKSNRHLLENLAWGVIKKGWSSSQMNIRLNSLLGAAFTQDAKAVPVLVKQMRDTNAYLRSVAVQLAGNYGDVPLQEELMRMLSNEKVWYVRLEVIKAIGKLRLNQVRDKLKEIIAYKKTMAEEKATAIIALVNMYDNVDEEELKGLIKNKRSGLRQLGCELIGHLEFESFYPVFFTLINDANPQVKVSALNCLSALRLDLNEEQIEEIATVLNDSSPQVAITAARLLSLYKDHRGLDRIEEYLYDKDESNRRLASAALAVTGPIGLDLMKQVLNKSSDPYVRANLALGLIGQREEIRSASGVLFDVLQNEQETLWMWDSCGNPHFRSLAPSRVRHIEQIPNYPVVVDQMTRLDLLNILSMLHHPRAQDAIKNFLHSRTWGVTGAAAMNLLTTGDEEALDLIRELLTDSDKMVRVQAAMILAILGSDHDAIPVLQEAYPEVDREMRVHIIEAIAHIGDESSIPFLIDVLEEPFQVLRVVAASAIVKALYS